MFLKPKKRDCLCKVNVHQKRLAWQDVQAMQDGGAVVFVKIQEEEIRQSTESYKHKT